MGKIGFVGQMAMMFLFPAGIGSMFIKGLGALGKTLAGVGGVGGGLFSKAVQGVGKILLKARDFAVGAKAGFSSLTNGIKEFGKTALSKVGFNIEGAATNFFGEGETAFSRTFFNLLRSVTSANKPFSHFNLISRGPPSFVATIGNPQEAASRRVSPKGSVKAGFTKIPPLLAAHL